MEEKLFDYFKDGRKLDDLTPLQVEKFKEACRKAISENPGLGFRDLIEACNHYLVYIKRFPDLSL